MMRNITIVRPTMTMINIVLWLMLFCSAVYRENIVERERIYIQRTFRYIVHSKREILNM